MPRSEVSNETLGRENRSVVDLTTLHQRLLVPALDSLDVSLRQRLEGSPYRLDRASWISTRDSIT